MKSLTWKFHSFLKVRHSYIYIGKGSINNLRIMATIGKSNLSREDIRSADKDEKVSILFDVWCLK